MVAHAQERDKTSGETLRKPRAREPTSRRRSSRSSRRCWARTADPPRETPKLQKSENNSIAYEKEVHDPDVIASAQAELAWPDLDSDHGRSVIDGFYMLIDHWRPAAADKILPGPSELDGHAEFYRKYLKKHESAKGPSRSAWPGIARTARASERGAKLVTLLQDSTRRGSNSSIKLSGSTTIIRRSGSGSRCGTLSMFSATTCSSASRYDETLKLSSQGSLEPEPVKRKDVQVVLKGKSETVPLGNGEAVPPGTEVVDEYNLKTDQIDHFELPGETRDPPGPGIPPLKGTQYSDAIRAYNTERERIKEWSARHLQTLQEICSKHEADLKGGGSANPGGQTLLSRINGLLEIVHRHPSLFVAN